MRRLLSDWQVAPILQIHTGQWLTVLSGTDRALTTIASQTVNQVLPNAYASNKGTANGNDTLNWLNPAAGLCAQFGRQSGRLALAAKNAGRLARAEDVQFVHPWGRMNEAQFGFAGRGRL